MDYERDTRFAYRSADRAAAYHHRQTRSWTWSRVSTLLEQRAIAAMLQQVEGAGGTALLDAPCGTGIAARLVRGRRMDVLASDISVEMMRHARGEYAGVTSRFVCADVTSMPLPDASFDCVVTLGFMHRVPAPVRRRTFAELARVTRRFVIVTCSLDSSSQRLKHRVLRVVSRGHVPAPSPATLEQIHADFEAAGLAEQRRVAIAPFMSAEHLFLLVKT
jgi:ubiquinone/menaquinone biosynthesis C-methylase UbiE